MVRKKLLPLTQLANQIQLLQHKLQWKQLLIFESFLGDRERFQCHAKNQMKLKKRKQN